MAHERALPASIGFPVLPVVAVVLAMVIFTLDTFILLPDAVAALYVVAVLLSVNFLEWRGVLLVSVGCAALAVLSYLMQHGMSYDGDPIVRLFVCVSAIGATAFLALKNKTAAVMLARTGRDFST